MTSDFAACAEKTAFILGFTGEIGKEVTRELLEKKLFKKLILIGRRQVAFEDPLHANVEQRIVDFDNLDSNKDAFQGCELGFCCLGTYVGAVSKEDYVKIEHDYVINCARLAHEMGCKRFSIISAMDSKKDSFILYQRTKVMLINVAIGHFSVFKRFHATFQYRTEVDLSEIPFEKVTIARPGLLLSDRNKTKMREKISVCIFKPIIWAKPTLMSIPTTKVAKAMIISMCLDPIGERKDILPNAKMHELADNYDKMFPAQSISQ